MLGRVVIKISTDIKANPKAVIEMLEKTAREQPNVQQNPPPITVLESFTPDNLMFSLSFTLSNVNAGGRVKSELHIAILDAFRESGTYGTLH
jgi:small-conductance mechanosensitive channel